MIRRAARSIPLYLALLVATIAIGLATRRYPAAFPHWIAEYAGDALWAVMIFWLVALIWRRADTLRIAAAALAISFAVELSQLYHAAWIDAIRGTTLGALMLGQGFLWSDLGAYAVGVLGAALVDLSLRRPPTISLP